MAISESAAKEAERELSIRRGRTYSLSLVIDEKEPQLKRLLFIQSMMVR